MHEWLLEIVILPTIKSMCELCEKHGISFVCYIEHKDKLTTDYVTHAVQGDASELAHNTLKAAQGFENVNPS